MDLKNFLCTLVISSLMLGFCVQAVNSKMAYDKFIQIKDKSYNNGTLDAQSTGKNLSVTSNEFDSLSITTPYHKDSFMASDVTADLHEIACKEDSTTMRYMRTTTNLPRDISCTCGIFLSSQFVKGSSEPPRGEPVISAALERSFVCNPIGQKQCQTKCLEQIVQHLPNSAHILCASLGRDIRKEKAFLFVRNCNSKWHNTNLTAGREYCCKNGLPYNCPKN